jgi:hypothetical protein
MGLMPQKKAFAAAFITSTALVQPMMAQVVTNGSFESGLSGWSCTGADSCTTSSEAFDGALAATGFDNTGFATLSQTVSTTSGATYELSFAHRVVLVRPSNVLRYAFDGAAPIDVDESTTWTVQTDTFVASGSTADLSFFFETDSGTGSVFFDAVSLTLLLPPGPTPDEEIAQLAASANAAARLVVLNADGVARTRGQDSLTTREEVLSFTRTADPETGSFTITQSTMDNPQMMGGLYTWIDLTGFRAEDDGTARSYTGRGLQIGADIEVMPDMVVGLSLGVTDLDASVGTVVQDGILRYLQPYMAYRSGAWSGEASLLYGRGDYTQTTGGGTGEGETRLTAITFDGGYDIVLDGGWTITPMLGLVHGVERITGVSGTLAGAGTERVRFTQASLGAEISQSMGSSEFFTGLHADWLDTDADTALVSDLLVDDGWTGRLELGLSTEIGNGISFDTSVELSGLGGDLRSTSGALRFEFRF